MSVPSSTYAGHQKAPVMWRTSALALLQHALLTPRHRTTHHVAGELGPAPISPNPNAPRPEHSHSGYTCSRSSSEQRRPIPSAAGHPQQQIDHTNSTCPERLPSTCHHGDDMMITIVLGDALRCPHASSLPVARASSSCTSLASRSPHTLPHSLLHSR
jgi:hypothetical protein